MPQKRRLGTFWKNAKDVLTRATEHESGTSKQTCHSKPTVYVHGQLNEGEFRLLEILPPTAPDDCIISCNIQIASFQGPIQPEYEAISYVWGDSTPSSIIHVNGLPFRLPVNSEKALRRTALPEQKRIVYLDAVCINQSDLEERKSQVMMMGQIYRNAQGTVVDIGDADERTGPAMRNLEDLSQEMQGDIQRHEVPYASGLAGLVWREDGLVGGSGRPPRTEVDEVALAQLFQRPWFRRVWVVQEIALSRKSILLCGPFKLDMDVVLDIGTWLFRYHGNHTAESLVRSLDGVEMIWTIRDGLIRGMPPTLDTILQYTRELKSSDLRDKVYGMLGVIELSRFNMTIVPDYTLTASQVFRDAVRQSLARSPWALGAVCHESEADLYRTDLPSWVPRLDRPWKQGVDTYPLPSHGLFKTSSSVIAQPVDGEAQSPDVLTLSGIVLGHITEVSPVLDDSRPTANEEPDVFLSWCISIFELLTRRGMSSEDTGRILLSDTNIQSQQSSPYDNQGFSKVLKKRHWIPIPHITETTDPEVAQASRFIPAMVRTCSQRRIGIMSDKSICVVPKLTQSSDIVISLQGGLLPLVLRPRGGDYLLLGECYVDGCMSWQRHGLGIRKRLLTEDALLLKVR